MFIPSNRISVLYVDDEQALLDLCKEFLERRDMFTVDTAHSATEALAILQNKKYEGVISDYQMPEMDGIELLKSIRSRHPNLPFILFTGKGREEVVIQAFDAGADYYVQKGQDIRSQFRELSHKIKLAVEKRHIEEALKGSEERYRNVIEDQTEFICRFRPDGIHNFVNDAYCRYFGLKRDEILGHRFRPNIPAEDQESVKRFFESLTPDNPVDIIEHRIIMPDGSIRWQWWSDRAIFEESSTLVEYQSVGRDITDRRTAELDLRKKNEEIRAAYEQISATEEELRQNYEELGKSQQDLHAAYEQLTSTEEELRQNYEELGKSEQALRKSEERYRNVVEDQTEFICRFTPDGKLTFVNDAYCRYFGLDKETCIGTRQTIVIPSEDLERMNRHLSGFSPQNPFGIIEHRIIMPSGNVRWQRWSDRAIFDENGHVVEYQSVGRDITDRIDAEERVKKSEIRYRGLFEGVPIGLYRTTPSGQILDINPALVRLLGYPDRESLLAISVSDLYMDPGDRCQWLALIEREGIVRDFEVQFRRYDGTIIWVWDTGETVRDDNNQVIYYNGNIEDITERKRAEVALRESEERYRTLVASVADAVILQEKTGEILTWNRAAERLFGVTVGEVLGHTATSRKWKTIREDGTDFPDSEHPSMHTLATGEACTNIVMGITSASGSFSWVNINTNPLFREGDAKPYAVVISLLDITERKQVADELRKSENLFRSVGNSLLDPVLILSSEGIIQFANRAALQFIGLPDAAIIRGQSFMTYLDGDSRNRAIADLHTIHELGGPLTAEYCVNPLKGETRWVEANGVRIDYKGSRAALVTLRDITKRIRVKEQLLGSERRLADIISFLPDATLVIDKNGAVLAWNRAMEEMTGVPAEQMIGKANYEYALPFYHERRPIMADLVLHDDPAVVAKYPVIKKEGSSLFSEIFIPHLNKGRGAYLWFTASPLYDTAGNLVGAIESIRDITERKRAEDALRESEERYHNVVEDQTEFICRFLPDGTHIFVNDSCCRYFGKKREEIIGHRFSPVLHPENQEIVARHIASITPEHPVTDLDLQIVMPDGSARWQRWSYRAVFDPDGRVIEYQSVGRDISEQKELEEEMMYHEQELRKFTTSLAMANKKLTLLYSIMRHDINNQLQAINGFLELLHTEVPDPALLSYFSRIKNASARITAMIQFTREYEQIGVNVPVWQDCRTRVDTAAKEAPLGKVMMKNDLPAGAEVFADSMIVRVFYNLMDNAVRHGGKITFIRFSMEERDGDRIIVCEDDGAGVPAEEKERIFDRGFGKNTGLGLALAREILVITGITIRETGEPATGARFEIHIPRDTFRFVR